MTSGWVRGLSAVLIFVAVLASLIIFPGYIETIARFLRLPPIERALTPDANTTVEWAQEVLRTGHQFVAYLWVLGSIVTGLLAAVAYYFFTWSNEHKSLLHAMSSWQDTVRRSEAAMLEAAQKLPLGVFVDFRDPAVSQRFKQATADLLSDLSPEEIDIQVSSTALVSPVPSDIYIRLGNYFRFRAHRAYRAGKGETRTRDLWYALRRYRRAEDAAKAERGKSAKLMLAHASLGIAICLTQLKRNHEAIPYARKAIAYLSQLLIVSESVPALDTYGLALKRCKRFREAVEAFEHALAISPRDPACNYNLACCYARWGDALQNEEGKVKHQTALKILADLAGTIRPQEKHLISNMEDDEDFARLKADPSLQENFEVILLRFKTRMSL